jgi:hypothetical protein
MEASTQQMEYLDESLRPFYEKLIAIKSSLQGLQAKVYGAQDSHALLQLQKELIGIENGKSLHAL